MLRDKAKGADYITRFGGEEFCVVLKDISKEEAVEWFVKMRAKIARSTLQVKKRDIKYTISTGVSFRSEHTLDEIIEEADAALYRAKKNGRNRVEIYEEV